MFSNFGSRLTNLRRAMAGEEVDDSDDEHSSYISNVLRTYYTDRNRPYPHWLPPDPKGKIPVPVAPQLATSHSTPSFQGYGGGGGGGAAHAGPASAATTTAGGAPPRTPGAGQQPGAGGGLADLWGDSGADKAAPPQVSSLRRGRTPQATAAQPSAGRASADGYFNRANGSGGGSGPGAYASPGSQKGPSAQERLRARLQGR